MVTKDLHTYTNKVRTQHRFDLLHCFFTLRLNRFLLRLCFGFLFNLLFLCLTLLLPSSFLLLLLLFSLLSLFRRSLSSLSNLSLAHSPFSLCFCRFNSLLSLFCRFNSSSFTLFPSFQLLSSSIPPFSSPILPSLSSQNFILLTVLTFQLSPPPVLQLFLSLLCSVLSVLCRFAIVHLVLIVPSLCGCFQSRLLVACLFLQCWLRFCHSYHTCYRFSVSVCSVSQRPDVEMVNFDFEETELQVLSVCVVLTLQSSFPNCVCMC